MKAFVAVMALAGASASPVADPALVYAGIPAVGGVVAPVVGTVDTGLKFHPSSGAVTPDFTAEQKEAAPELAANQKDIKHLAYTGAVVHQPTVFHTAGYHLVGKREAEAEAEADPALLYTGVAGVHHVAPVVAAPAVVAPAVYTKDGLVAHADGAVTPDYTPAQKVAAATHFAAKGIHPVFHSGLYLGKREAEAKSDAWGYGYGLPYAYGGAYASPYYGHYLGKRDAEAKSDAWGYYGLPYGGVYSPYTYGGVRYLGKRDAEAKSDAWGYYGLPYGGVYSPYTYGGVRYLGKRDAEAKSDAWGYYGLPYGGVYSPYTTYGGYHFGKRDAEAKPWGYYGLPYGGVYGGWPYVY